MRSKLDFKKTGLIFQNEISAGKKTFKYDYKIAAMGYLLDLGCWEEENVILIFNII